MITLISGPIDSGKTSALAKHFAEHTHGDGFMAQKIYRGTHVYGYEAVRLSNQEILPWLIRDEFYLHEFEIESRIGPFVANMESLKTMEVAYETMLRQGIQPIYFDEIGEWELSGQGFDAIFRKMLTSRCDLIVVVREELLPRVISHYGLQDYAIIGSSK